MRGSAAPGQCNAQGGLLLPSKNAGEMLALRGQGAILATGDYDR